MKEHKKATLFLITLISNVVLSVASVPVQHHNYKEKQHNHIVYPDEDTEILNKLNELRRLPYDLPHSHKQLEDIPVYWNQPHLGDPLLMKALKTQAEYLSSLKKRPPYNVEAGHYHPSRNAMEMREIPDYMELRPDQEEDVPVEQKVVVQTYSDPQKSDDEQINNDIGPHLKHQQQPAASKMIMDEDNVKVVTLATKPSRIDPKQLDQLTKLILLNEKTRLLKKELEQSIIMANTDGGQNKVKDDKENKMAAKNGGRYEVAPAMAEAAALKQSEEAWLQLKNQQSNSMAQIYLLAVVAGCSVAAFAGFIVAAVCWYKHKKNPKNMKGDFPGYGITGPNLKEKASPGDRKLAQNAQMYHYQHQKQQMIASERGNGDANAAASEGESEEENEEGDFTVFECQGLATTGEMEVQNPLFKETPGVAPSTQLANHK